MNSIALILLLATGLYLYQLGEESLWADELYSIRDAKEPSLTLRVDRTRPAYYILLRINHAQEVRMYTLDTFLGLGGTLVLTHVLEHPTPSLMRWWAGAQLLIILSMPLNFTSDLAPASLFTPLSPPKSWGEANF